MSNPAQSAPPKIGFVSLGCPKATADTERMLTRLRAEGYVFAPDYASADVVIVNTCGFIDAAVEESLDAIGEALNENGRVIVTGCLGAREEVIREAHPQVLAVTGPAQEEAVLQAVHAELPPPSYAQGALIPVPAEGIRLTPKHYAWIKIAEGCNQSCSFCVIPQLRGKLVSRPLSDVISEGERLLEAGTQELLIVSQDTVAYGADLRYRTELMGANAMQTRITTLTRELGERAQRYGAWVRLHYLYPYPMVDQLVELMADGLIAPYLDLPLQHGSPTVLRAMRRPADQENVLERIAKWRARVPDLTLRSTFIVGFPGERDEDFEQLLDFLEAAEIDRAGAFAYSPIEGAPANALANPVSEALKEERLAAFMDLQQQISAERLARRIGHIEQVVIDEVSAEGAIARSIHEAPEIDGVIHLPELDGVEVGERIKVRITNSDAHDLEGERIREMRT
jgi:ribosomal protein S12 methylthiotransferase